MAKLRKCRWCGQPVSPNASSCPSCRRGLTEWPIHNITAKCGSCGTPIFVHTAWARGYQGPTQTNVTISGDTGTISHSGASSWPWPRDCPKCGDQDPLRAATRRWWLSLPLWFCVIWMFGRMFQFQNYMKTHHNAPGQAVTAALRPAHIARM